MYTYSCILKKLEIPMHRETYSFLIWKDDGDHEIFQAAFHDFSTDKGKATDVIVWTS